LRYGPPLEPSLGFRRLAPLLMSMSFHLGILA
jgi:hypothetical protein